MDSALPRAPLAALALLSACTLVLPSHRPGEGGPDSEAPDSGPDSDVDRDAGSALDAEEDAEAGRDGARERAEGAGKWRRKGGEVAPAGPSCDGEEGRVGRATLQPGGTGNSGLHKPVSGSTRPTPSVRPAHRSP